MPENVPEQRAHLQPRCFRDRFLKKGTPDSAPPENCGPWTLATIGHYSLPRIFFAMVFAFSVAAFSSSIPLIATVMNAFALAT